VNGRGVNLKLCGAIGEQVNAHSINAMKSNSTFIGSFDEMKGWLFLVNLLKRIENFLLI